MRGEGWEEVEDGVTMMKLELMMLMELRVTLGRLRVTWGLSSTSRGVHRSIHAIVQFYHIPFDIVYFKNIVIFMTRYSCCYKCHQ